MPEMLPTPTPQNLHLAGGMCLRIWDFGGDGPVTLALHGFLDTGRSFAGVAQHWGPTQRILALDWRGHGESDRVGKGGQLGVFFGNLRYEGLAEADVLRT